MDLAGRRVLITGGGTGVGADLARGFSEAGAEVVIAGRRPEPLEKVVAGLARSRFVLADVTQEASVAAMFEAAGPCDIVIANAGSADSAPFARLSMEQWNSLIAVNLTGVFLTFRGGLRQMTGWGRLIAVASIYGLRGHPYAAAYSASKHGVMGLTKSVALDVVKRPVTVNAICPGYLLTEMTERSIANIMQKTGRDRSSAEAVLAETSPQKRLIEPSEVTAAALWLCGPGSQGVNGQAITISGGDP